MVVTKRIVRFVAASVAAPGIDVYISSEGCDDRPKTPNTCGIAYIKVNGEDYSRHGRGHNVVVVDGATGVWTTVNILLLNSYLLLRNSSIMVTSKELLLAQAWSKWPFRVSQEVSLFLGRIVRKSFIISWKTCASKCEYCWIIHEKTTKTLFDLKRPRGFFSRAQNSLSPRRTVFQCNLRNEYCKRFDLRTIVGSQTRHMFFSFSFSYHLGVILDSKVFDTYGIKSAGNNLRDYLNSIKGKYVILFQG